MTKVACGRLPAALTQWHSRRHKRQISSVTGHRSPAASRARLPLPGLLAAMYFSRH